MPQLYPVTKQDLAAGQAILQGFADEPHGHWFTPGAGWVPPPAADGVPNAAWTRGRCAECLAYRFTLIALLPIPGNGEIVVARGAIVRVPDRTYNLEVTFDGGARLVGPTRVAGAGAVVWLPCRDSLNMAPVAAVSIALPGEEHAQVAEAWAGRAAIRAALQLDFVCGSRRCTGDNLTIVRYGAGQGRLHKVELQGVLEQPLSELAAAGRHCEWLAARRRFNKRADEVATAALMRAAALRDLGHTAPAAMVHILDLHRAGPTVVQALESRKHW